MERIDMESLLAWWDAACRTTYAGGRKFPGGRPECPGGTTVGSQVISIPGGIGDAVDLFATQDPSSPRPSSPIALPPTGGRGGLGGGGSGRAGGISDSLQRWRVAPGVMVRQRRVPRKGQRAQAPKPDSTTNIDEEQGTGVAYLCFLE